MDPDPIFHWESLCPAAAVAVELWVKLVRTRSLLTDVQTNNSWPGIQRSPTMET